MKLWQLKLKGFKNSYDVTNGLVVRAKTPQKARKLASKECGDEGPDSWLSPNFSSCRRLKVDGPEGVIFTDFNAG